jgi:DNA-directed RNA polymerase specialized sigma24 family protein
MPVPSVYVVPGAESVNDLVNRVADRDQAAFGRLYRRLVRAVFMQVCESVGSPALAVAVTRAVFVEVWRLAPMPASRELDGLAWVTAIAARRAADRLREISDPTPGLGTGYDDLLGRELAVALGAEPPAQLGTCFRAPSRDCLPLAAY